MSDDMDTFSEWDLEQLVIRAVTRASGSLIGGSQNTVHLHLHLTDESTVVESLLAAITAGGVQVRVSDYRRVACNHQDSTGGSS